MRILHTSDWHVGRTLHGESLHAAHEAWFDHLEDLVRSERLDAVLVAGDIFDRAIPPLASMDLLSDALSRLAAHTRVILTPGNHDSAQRLGFASELLGDRLVVRSRVRGVGTPVELADAAGGTGALLYPLPYLDPEMTRRELGEEEAPVARSHEAVLTAAMARVNADLAARRQAAGRRVPAMVAAHAFVVGGEPSESERDLRVGGVETVPAGVFGTKADYLALGHLHGPQEVPAGIPARYAGSPVAFSFSERSHTKSSAIITLEEGREARHELIEAPVTRRLRQLRGPLEWVLTQDGQEDWVKVEVTDPVRPDHLRERIKERFPHALVTVHDPEGGVAELRGRVVTAASDPVAVMRDFVGEILGRPATEPEQAELTTSYEAAREAVA